MKQIKLLVVEDSDFSQLMIERLATLCGYEHKIVNSGQKAIDELAQNANFDLILMNLEMPEIDGFETTRKIYERYDKVGIPIVAMIGHSENDYAEKIKKAAFADSIYKPLSKMMLQNLVEKHITGKNNDDAKQKQDNTKLYNLSSVEEFAEDDNEFTKKVLLIFVNDTPQTIQNMENAFSAKDWDKLREISHKYISHVSFLQIEKATKITKEIEKLAEQKSEEQQIEKLIKELKHECSKVIAQLKNDFEL
ncbi:MAG: hypothetical protein CSA05_02555 [Bacteroidia bacterium]|nr:MAG: hypothetical protein CSA05_02555 [Bacteroidia bacterium]